MMKRNAQIGSGITWIVATFVILVILAGGIFMAQGFGKTKSLLGWEKNSVYMKISDRTLEISINSYLLTEGTDGKTFYDRIRNGGNLDSVNGEAAQKIFSNSSWKEYSRIWVGVSSAPGDQFVGKDNPFFGGKPRNPVIGDPALGDLELIPGLTYISSSRWLKDKDFFQVFSNKKLNFGNP
jgi:hypothetical protein